MKHHLYYYIFVSMFILAFLSCEEVVDVEVKTQEPRLVVEASINWIKDTDGRLQRIILSQTAPYFDQNIPAVTGAIVYIENADGERYEFIEIEDSGIYICDDFEAQMHMAYTLNIQYLDEHYTAQETMTPVTQLTYMTQNNGTVFGNEYIELKAYFNDPKEEENFYFYKFEAQNDHNINVIEDRLLNGNEMFGIFVSEDLTIGEEVQISLYGVSRRYYSYIYTLIAQSGENIGPFQTQPATVKGNIVNLSNPDNFALGYFRVSESDIYTYIVE